MSQNNELETYRQKVEERLARLSPTLQRYALGDFSDHIEIPDEEDEFTELLVGLSLMADDIREIMVEKEASIRELHLKNTVVECSMAGNSIADEKGAITLCNPAFLRMWGIEDHNDAIGRSVADYFAHPEDAEPVLEALGSTGEWKGEFLARRMDGSTFISRGLATVIRNTEGEIIAYQSANLDISEEKSGQEALMLSEQKYQDLYENAPDLYCSVDPGSGDIMECNRTLCIATGFSKEEIIGHPIFDRYHESCLEDAKAAFMSFVKTGTVRDAELRLLKKDGGYMDVLLNVTAVRDEQGSILYSRSVWHDITARKLAERETAEMNARFRTIADTMPLSLVIENEAGDLTYVNRRFIEEFGYSHEEVPTLEDWWMKAYPDPAYRDQVFRDWMEAREEAERTGNDIEPQHCWVTCRDGTRKRVEFFHAPVGDIRINILNDITDIKRSEERLTAMMRELERSNTELEQVAYVASHDLQEPLRKVKSFTELLARRLEDQTDDRIEKYMNYIVSGTSRMQDLLNDLLTYSRITTQGKPFETVHLDEIFSKSVMNLSAAIQENDAMVTRDSLPYIHADRSQMLQLFQNLLGNGIKFHGEKRPMVHVRATETDAGWELLFQDNGIGIDPDQQGRIFEVFQRLHPRGAYPGSGIGLAIVKKIVDRHSGTISVESTPGTGSKFSVVLHSMKEECGESETGRTGAGGLEPPEDEEKAQENDTKEQRGESNGI